MAKGDKTRDDEGRLVSMVCKRCEAEVNLKDLHGHDTECECGAEYNSSGQMLKPNTERF